MLRPKRYASDVAFDLVEGLRNGTVSLRTEPQPQAVGSLFMGSREVGVGRASAEEPAGQRKQFLVAIAAVLSVVAELLFLFILLFSFQRVGLVVAFAAGVTLVAVLAGKAIRDRILTLHRSNR